MLVMLVAGWFVHTECRMGLRAGKPLSPRGCLFSLGVSFPRYEQNGVWHLVAEVPSSCYEGLTGLKFPTNLDWS